ncbi:MAG: hypothetical protein ACRED4_05935, partial [Brevundimonas sp.]
MTPLQVLKPQASSLQEGNHIGRVHAEWVALSAAGALSEAIRVVQALDIYDNPSHLLNSRLREMRLWLPGALLKRGRAGEAQ